MMKRFQELTCSQGPSAVALGCFDGLHTGHVQVLRAARAPGLGASVLTFQPDILRDGKDAPALLSQARKMSLLEGMGIQQCWQLAFSDIRDMSARQFVQQVLRDVCRARRVCCGFNFHFGKGGVGDSALLRELCAEEKIEVVVVPPVEVLGEPVSSTRIRGLLQAGDAAAANRLLGHPFCVDFQVIHGRRLGRRLGFPTINQVFPDGFLLPRFGVYASVTELNGAAYYGVTNIGVKPTVGADRPLSETWLPGYRGPEVYGERPAVEILEFIRPERKFDSLESLRAQIFQDGETARKIVYKARSV